MVHVHAGDEFLRRLAAEGVPGRRLKSSDPVCDGPTPAGLSDDAWYDLRGSYLADLVEGDARAIAADLRAEDQAVEAAAAAEELVLWFGAELYCQAILMRLLARFARRPFVQLTIVDIGDLPGSPGCGLGKELTREALLEKLAARQPATPATLELARQAWEAFTAADPTSLITFVAQPNPLLPYLGAALRRHLEELPDARTGLGRTEQQVLEAVRDGASTELELFHAVKGREARPFVTDTILRAHLRRLQPLLTGFTLNARGERVLAGVERWSVERWVGGVRAL